MSWGTFTAGGPLKKSSEVSLTLLPEASRALPACEIGGRATSTRPRLSTAVSQTLEDRFTSLRRPWRQ